MRITARHVSDDQGNPSGGHTNGVGLSIVWQQGALVRDGQRLSQNGAFVEDVILAALNRLQYYQSTRFACDKNQEAIARLGDALASLAERTKDREARGVEGTHTV